MSWTHTFSNPHENFTKNSHQFGPESVIILWGLLNVCVQDQHFSKYYSAALQSNINITLQRCRVILVLWLKGTGWTKQKFPFFNAPKNNETCFFRDFYLLGAWHAPLHWQIWIRINFIHSFSFNNLTIRGMGISHISI